MKVIAVTLGVIGLFFLICLLTIVGSYNGLVASSQAVDQQWAQVQNVYQRRADLVPNLVSTVSGAAHFEQSTLEAVTEARASVGRVNIDASSAPTDAAKLQQFEQAQGSLSNALSRLLVVTENYPDLKSSQSFLDLQAQLEGTENRISVERGKFNQAVQDYDTRIVSFPDVLLARMMGFTSKPYFAASQAAQTAPQVQFDFNSSQTSPTH
ncbi:MAG TPA: LemA family protein [Tepidisphaeraceae bacterium]|nr:LemA family protein [Tepidisphaeraceae bacterium]